MSRYGIIVMVCIIIFVVAAAIYLSDGDRLINLALKLGIIQPEQYDPGNIHIVFPDSTVVAIPILEILNDLSTKEQADLNTALILAQMRFSDARVYGTLIKFLPDNAQYKKLVPKEQVDDEIPEVQDEPEK